jgi:pilus assembly protein TadC
MTVALQTLSASAGLCAAAVLVAPLPAVSARAELLATLDRRDAPARPPVGDRVQRMLRSTVGARIACGVMGSAVALALGGYTGLIVGSVAAVGGVRVLRRLESGASRSRREQRRADLPDVLSLLAAALSAGLPVSTALAAVADAAGGPLAPDLVRVSELSALGAGPAAAWGEIADDPVLGEVARAARRSADSGAALAEAMERLAADLRADAQYRAEATARRAGVLAMAPLALCFLPAFVCLGLVPVVVGMSQQFQF